MTARERRINEAFKSLSELFHRLLKDYELDLKQGLKVCIEQLEGYDHELGIEVISAFIEIYKQEYIEIKKAKGG